jgi:hypothetical protein
MLVSERCLEIDGPDEMLNVVSFRERAPRARGSRQRPLANVDADISELASSVSSQQSKAREAIHHAILVLDLATQHARQIAKRMCDPTARKIFDEQISIIEQLLQIARDMALKL